MSKYTLNQWERCWKKIIWSKSARSQTMLASWIGAFEEGKSSERRIGGDCLFYSKFCWLHSAPCDSQMSRARILDIQLFEFQISFYPNICIDHICHTQDSDPTPRNTLFVRCIGRFVIIFCSDPPFSNHTTSQCCNPIHSFKKCWRGTQQGSKSSAY